MAKTKQLTKQQIERQNELREIVYRDCLSTLDQYLDDHCCDGKTFSLDQLITDEPNNKKGVLACQFFLVSRLSNPHVDVKDLIKTEMYNHGWIRREDDATGRITYTKPTQN